MPYRTRLAEIRYKRHLKARKSSASCPFCVIDAYSDQLVRETEHFKVIYNIFPYNNWDYSNVIEHLMLVPKQHTDTLNTLSPKAMQEYVKELSNYESTGYDVFARSPNSSRKTVIHQHTHLIKTDRH